LASWGKFYAAWRPQKAVREKGYPIEDVEKLYSAIDPAGLLVAGGGGDFGTAERRW